jgi:hypothetical protein
LETTVSPFIDPPIAPPSMTLTNGLGGFTTRAGLSIVLQARNAAAVGERHRELTGTIVTASGSAHTWSEQPRKPIDIVRQRSRRRPDGRSPVHSRRLGDAWCSRGADDTARDERQFVVHLGRSHAFSGRREACTTHVFVDVDDPEVSLLR